MSTLRALYYLAISDFFERARSYRFLLTLAAVIGMGVLVNNGTLLVQMMPSDPALYSSTSYRGEFNSAWIGSMTVLVINVFLSLFGFYLVKDCIERDARTGVGQIIATTPVSRAAYLIGKWISNCLVLYGLVLILAAAAAVMVLLRGEAVLDLGALLMPFFAFALPLMALVAALAVVFETVPMLRGAVGNVAYFFLWLTLISSTYVKAENLPFRIDPLGYNTFNSAIAAAAHAVFPGQTANGISVGIANPGVHYFTFTWPGLTWTPDVIAGQWLWGSFGLGIILISALWFSRFDPSSGGLHLARRNSHKGKDDVPAEPITKIPRIKLPSLSPMFSELAQLNPFLGVLMAELRLLLNGRRWWWWLVVIGLNIGILASPADVVIDYLLPFIWLWPLALWSGMGNRERKQNTSQMVFSSSRPVLRQLPAAWLAGILATALISSAAGIFFLSTGDLPGLAGWVSAVVFIPSLALAMGVLSSGNRVFEVIYIIWWYIGVMQKTPGLDITRDVPHVYLLAATGLLLVAALGRSRQVRF